VVIKGVSISAYFPPVQELGLAKVSSNLGACGRSTWHLALLWTSKQTPGDQSTIQKLLFDLEILVIGIGTGQRSERDRRRHMNPTNFAPTSSYILDRPVI
jgi:hypothetical protein